MDLLVRFALRLRNLRIVRFLSFVDETVHVLNGFVHVFERHLHSFRRNDVLQLHGDDADSKSERGKIFVHHFQSLHFDFGAVASHHVQNGAVAHKFVYDRTRNVADCLLFFVHAEKPLARIHDSILNYPFHVHDVQVAGEHRRFRGDIVAIFVRASGLDRGESELFGLDDFHWHIEILVDSKRHFELKPGIRSLEIFSKTSDDGLFSFIDNVKTRANNHEKKRGEKQQNPSRWPRKKIFHFCRIRRILIFHNYNVANFQEIV